jgi:type I restriction enzyme S subunit
VTAVPTAILSQVAELNPPLPEKPSHDAIVSFVPMAGVSAITGDTNGGERRIYRDVAKSYTPFLAGDLLVAKITPCFENGKIVQANIGNRVGFGSSEFHVVRPRPGRVDARYLLHFLRQERVRLDGARQMTGSAGQRRVPEHFLAELAVPLPPLSEQRRVAAILDKADELRAKRRAALEMLHGLTQSVFFEMFGDAASNERGWAVQAFGELLREPLRNGVSPSKSGRVHSRVLTLTAVTGSSFNETAWKFATFANEPPPDQRVHEKDFLICRGNGNLGLVGRGYFPSRSMPDVVFPDTIIAGRVEHNRLSPTYLETLWNSLAVRRQIETLARTTTGTFKVNQSMLEEIRLILPPLALQQKFGNRMGAVRKLLTTNLRYLDASDGLFNTLQHRAFAGAL